MNIILSAINTKHTHSALALACLKSYWELNHTQPLTIKEFDLNILTETIINDLILMEPDILAFSTYIWSLERIITVVSGIKAAFPNCKIILGGPEVSYNSVELLQKHSNIDFIIRGEGELTFTDLLEALLNNNDLANIKGITYRNSENIIKNKDRSFIQDLDILPSPFLTGNYKGTASFTYYEASRGCPSKCAYCLSSIQGLVRNHSIERVKQDLDWFFNSDFDQIRFADRTFNFDSPRAREIITYIKAHNKKCKNFHFEIQADFLSDEIINLLSDAPRGMFHLEIGIQSTNPLALKAVNRSFDLKQMREKIEKLKSKTNCYLHLDVLGGLPYDTYQDFCKSLDDVASLKPDDIQISLIKILHGTPYEYMAKQGHFYYMKEAPYTILRTDWLKPHEAVMISQISKLYEGIGNTGRYNNSLAFLVNEYFNGSYSKLYESMVLFWRKKKYLFYNFSPENTFNHLLAFMNENFEYKNKNLLFQSILEHELRLSLKSANSDTFKGPEEVEISNKPKFKLPKNLRGYWYKYNPNILKIDENIANYPIIYSFDRLENGKPEIKVLNLSLEESFTLIAAQKKYNEDYWKVLWMNLYPARIVPDFNLITQDLISKKLILYTDHR